MKNSPQINRFTFLKKDPVVFFLLLFLGLLTFANSFDNEFLMDDFPILVGNLSIGAPEFLQLDPLAKTQVYFRPVGHILNLITFSLFGQSPAGYHFINLLLFVGASFVLFRLIEKVFLNRWAAFWTAALFLVHPVNSVCVNYKNATSYPFFVLSLGWALWHALVDAEENLWNEKVLTVVWLAVALFCHEIAFAFPLYLAALLFSSGRFSVNKIIKACIPSSVLLAVYFVFRLQFASLERTVLTQAGAVSASVLGFLADIGQIVFWYLSKLVFMQDIALMWDVPPVNGAVAGWILGLLAFMIAVAALIFYCRKRNPPAALGLLWFVSGFIPVLFACFSRPWFGIIVQPFWLIMSSAGFFLFAISVLQKVFAKQSLILTAFIICLTGTVIIPAAWRYNDLWGNAIRYSEYWMDISPKNFFPRFWLAYSLMDKKDYSRAKDVLLDLVDGGLRYEWTYGNLGIAEYHLKHYTEAESAFKNALSFDPHHGDTYYYLGLVFKSTGQIEKARRAFQAAIDLTPEIIDAKRQMESL